MNTQFNEIVARSSSVGLVPIQFRPEMEFAGSVENIERFGE